MAGGDAWDLPFKGEDFPEDQRVYWGREIHSSGGVQKHGYDLGAMRYDDSAKSWTEFKGSGEANTDWHIYGRPVYAMEDGKVIAGWRNAPENLKTGVGEGNWHEELTKYDDDKSRIYGGGNGLWIEHADGSRVEYAHFQPGTVPSSLCPHDDVLLPAIIDSPSVSKAWPHIRVPPAQQATVKKGQLLGLVGNSGTSSAPHLHIHREEGGTADTTKSGGTPVEFLFRRGLAIPPNDDGPYVEWESFAGGAIPPGPVLVWPPHTLRAEYARHGYPVERFGAVFQHLSDSGYWCEWMDLYTVGARTFVNHVWRPANAGWRAYFGIDAAAYQNVFDANKAEQFHPVFVESFVFAGQPRYAAIFVHKQPGSYRARHGITYDQHVEEMKAAEKAGLSPVTVSVVSVGGDRQYTVLYRKQDVTTWVVKSRLGEDQYQGEYDTQSKAGRKPIYLGAYMHGGKPYLSVVFANVKTSARKDRHGMSAAQYQTEFDDALKKGMRTRAVTSFDGAKTQHRFAAAWWK